MGVVSKPEVMFVFGESEITRYAIDDMIDHGDLFVVNYPRASSASISPLKQCDVQ